MSSPWYKGSTTFRVFPAVKGIKFRRHSVKVVVCIPATKNIYQNDRADDADDADDADNAGGIQLRLSLGNKNTGDDRVPCQYSPDDSIRMMMLMNTESLVNIKEMTGWEWWWQISYWMLDWGWQDDYGWFWREEGGR